MGWKDCPNCHAAFALQSSLNDHLKQCRPAPERRVEELETLLCRIAYVHQERDAPDGLALLGRMQDLARKEIEHIPWREAQERAEKHHAACRSK